MHEYPASRVGRGILFMLTAVAMFSCMNAVVKLLSADFHSIQIVWARTLGHFLFVMALFVPQSGFAVLRSRQLGAQFSRSILQMCSTALYFTALGYMGLAEATAIGFLSPMLVTLLAVPMLGERIDRNRLAVVCAGFVGVLIVVRPGSTVFHWASLLILCSSTFYATYQVLTRRVAGTDSAQTSAVYSAMVGSVLLSFIVPFFWTTPERWIDVALLLGLGVFGGIGHYCVATAMSSAPANLMSPFQYFQLIGASIFGYLMFDTLPSGYTWLGASVIVGSGLYLGWVESRKRA